MTPGWFLGELTELPHQERSGTQEEEIAVSMAEREVMLLVWDFLKHL